MKQSWPRQRVFLATLFMALCACSAPNEPDQADGSIAIEDMGVVTEDMGVATDMIESLDAGVPDEPVFESEACRTCVGIECFEACPSEDWWAPTTPLSCDAPHEESSESFQLQMYLDPANLRQEFFVRSEECNIDGRNEILVAWSAPQKGTYELFSAGFRGMHFTEEAAISGYGVAAVVRSPDYDNEPCYLATTGSLESTSCSPGENGYSKNLKMRLEQKQQAVFSLHIEEAGFYVMQLDRLVLSCDELECDLDTTRCGYRPDGFAACFPKEDPTPETCRPDSCDPGFLCMESDDTLTCVPDPDSDFVGLGENCRDKECRPGLYCETTSVCAFDGILHPVCVAPCSSDNDCNAGNIACSQRGALSSPACLDVNRLNDRKYCNWN